MDILKYYFGILDEWKFRKPKFFFIDLRTVYQV